MSDLVPVNLMTYNIQGLSNLVLPVANLSARVNHIGQYLLKIVQKYSIDVLILQEVFSIKLYWKIKEAISDLLSFDTGIKAKYRTTKCSTACLYILPEALRLIPSGVIIFSKYEIREKLRLLYKKVISTDRFASKGAILARVMIKDRLLDVVGTHLQSFEGESEHRVRKSQMQQVAKWLRNKRKDYEYRNGTVVSKTDIPLVFGGDLNECIVNSKELTTALFSLVSDICETIFGADGPQSTYSTSKNDFCKFQSEGIEYEHVYDYLMVSPNAVVLMPQTVVTDEMDTTLVVHKWIRWFIRGEAHIISHASDHLPVIATIGI